MRLLAVTSCVGGIAHTYMAAEALEAAAREAGHEIVVETQGSAGSTPFTGDQLAGADAIVFAADGGVRDRDRFTELPAVHAGVKNAINDAPALIAQAVRTAEAASGGMAPGTGVEHAPASPSADAAGDMSGGPRGAGAVRGWLMTGVSYVIPFVAAGGLLIALGFALGGYRISDAPSVVGGFTWTSQQSWAALLFQLGSVSFEFMVPVISGYVAYAIADRPALAPGFVGGMVAVTTKAGFLGGLVAGLLAGGLIYWMKRWTPPRALAALMPVMVLPLVGTLLVGSVMFVVVGQPLAAVTEGLTEALGSLSGTNAVLLGALLGLMMAFDMGGPVNKAASAFAIAGLTTGTEASLTVMAAVMASGMTPPVGLALACAVRKRLFTPAERESGRAAWLLGASFITEGAIPFAAADPLRVIPSIMTGSAVTGALSMAWGCTLRAPHGGIFVLPLIGNPFGYLAAILAGTAVTAAVVCALKSSGGKRTLSTPAARPAPDARTTAPAP